MIKDAAQLAADTHKAWMDTVATHKELTRQLERELATERAARERLDSALREANTCLQAHALRAAAAEAKDGDVAKLRKALETVSAYYSGSLDRQPPYVVVCRAALASVPAETPQGSAE